MNVTFKKYLHVIGLLAVGLVIGLLLKPSGNYQPLEHNHRVSETISELYTCSMHPQFRQSEPGDCPICGMDLIPLVSETNDVDPLSLAMSERAIQLANIQTMQVQSGDATTELMLNGKVQIDERKLYTQPAHISGRIESLLVNFTGEFVRNGQQLGTIYSPDLNTAQQELLETAKLKDSQPALYMAARNKLKNWKLSDKQINSILESGKTQTYFPILANVSGIVTNKLANLGDYISIGQPIYEISDLSKVWVMFDIYESNLPLVQLGDKIKIEVRSIPGLTLEGKISFIDPTINPNTRVASARVEVNNSEQKLKPEMFVIGVITQNSNNSSRIIVPKSAVLWTGKRSLVYVKQANAQGISFAMREVVLGELVGDHYIVEQGLESKEEIVTNGTFSVDAAAQLSGKPSMMNTSANPSKPQPAQLSVEAQAFISLFINGYLKLTKALSSDDLSTAHQNIRDLHGLMDKYSKNRPNEIQSQYSEAASNIKSILSEKDITKIRSSYLKVSEIAIYWADQYGTPDSQLYLQYCPMAKGDKGAYWLSESKEIENPYYGAAMLRCGETKRIIQ